LKPTPEQDAFEWLGRLAADTIEHFLELKDQDRRFLQRKPRN
jgi:hypothetical protein